MYEIILTDGTVLENLTLNGNNFVSQVEITEDIFKGNLKTVVIKNIDEETEQMYENMKLLFIQHYNDGYYFVLAQISEQELKEAKVRSDIDYIAMMSDIDLDA